MSNKAGEEIVITAGGFALLPHGGFPGGPSDQILRHVLDGAEVGWGVIGPRPAFVIAEHLVHDPVQAVLDGPMAPYDRCQHARQKQQRCGVEACLALHLVTDFAPALDDNHSVEAGPVVALAQPADIVDHSGGSGLDAAMIATHGLVVTDLGVLEPYSLLFCHEQLDVLAQRSLVALEGQHIFGLFLHDLLGDLPLAAHGVDGDDRPSDGEQLQQLGDGGDFVGLLRHLDLAKHEGCWAAKAENMWIDGLPLRLSPERRTVLPSMAITPSGDCPGAVPHPGCDCRAIGGRLKLRHIHPASASWPVNASMPAMVRYGEGWRFRHGIEEPTGLNRESHITPMELNQITYFVTLARTLHFTKAAEACNVTQPALTRAVQKLEEELGGRLLHRERDNTQLTDLSRMMLPPLERALAHLIHEHSRDSLAGVV